MSIQHENVRVKRGYVECGDDGHVTHYFNPDHIIQVVEEADARCELLLSDGTRCTVYAPAEAVLYAIEAIMNARRPTR